MIEQAGEKDLSDLALLGMELWPNCSKEELEEEFSQIMKKKASAFFLLKLQGRPEGFAQCQLRFDYVEGTSSSPAGYLEGIYVRPAVREKGWARALLRACESWAKEQGCKEFASDCGLDNQESLAFHLKNGFEEAGRIICFTKKI